MVNIVFLNTCFIFGLTRKSQKVGRHELFLRIAPNGNLNASSPLFFEFDKLTKLCIKTKVVNIRGRLGWLCRG